MASPDAPSHRRRLLPADPWDIAAWALLAALAVGALLVFRDFGVTWDESLQQHYGELVLHYFATLGRDHGAFTYRDLRYYGPAFDLLAAALTRISPLGLYETRHLLGAGVGILGVAGAWRLGRRLAGPRAGLLGALLLVLCGRYVGHAFADPKDAPFAVGYVWSVLLLVAALPTLPRIPWRRALPLGLVVGITLGIRIGGLLLLVYLVGLLGGVVAWPVLQGGRWRRRGDGRFRALWPRARSAAASLARVAIPAWAVMVLLWPWVQPSPLVRPFMALAHMSHFPWDYPVRFLGAQIHATKLPWFYLPLWLAIALPEGLLALVLGGAAVGLAALARDCRRVLEPATQRHLVVAMAVVLPVAWVLVSRAVLYDGLRHMLFLVPPLAVLGGSALDAVLRRMARARPALRRLATGLTIFYLGVLAATLVRYHPYEYVYFNGLVGGLPGAASEFETDYWGASYKAAVARLETYVRTRCRGRPPPRLLVYSESGQPSTTYYLPRWLVSTRDRKLADFFLATTRRDRENEVGGRVIATVRRFEVPLNYVKELRTFTLDHACGPPPETRP